MQSYLAYWCGFRILQLINDSVIFLIDLIYVKYFAIIINSILIKNVKILKNI